jgi:TrmH family RNA methyltransferase
MSLLTSKEHPLAKQVRWVATQSRRAPRDLVLAEGLRVLEEATSSGCEIEAVLVTEDFGATEREKLLLSRWESADVRIARAAGPLLKSLSEVLTPQDALALVRVPILQLADLPVFSNPLIFCACGLQDPGNLGTLLRTALAAGASWGCSISGTVSARNPKVIRSSAGAFFRLPFVEDLKASEFLLYCKERGIRMFQADPCAGARYTEIDFTQPTATLLGNEAQGMQGKEWLEVSKVRIPMAPGIESLNVATAGALLLFEAFRQRSGPSITAETRRRREI